MSGSNKHLRRFGIGLLVGGTCAIVCTLLALLIMHAPYVLLTLIVAAAAYLIGLAAEYDDPYGW